jgi:hypothetical protein
MNTTFDRLIALDRLLVKSGFPPLSPWWLDTFREFLSSEKRQLVLRCGRRAGKSSSLCRLAVILALYGEHKIPPGDTGVFAFVSANTTEARARLRTIEKILDAMKVSFSKTKDEIVLTKQPIAFRIFAATVSGVVGFTSVGIIGDELSRWRDESSGVNPAAEVLASIRPTMATQPSARIILSSSPLSTSDAHYTAFELGDTEFQQVAGAPSWFANPTLTEEATHALEPDARVWRREYLAVPQNAELSAFDSNAVERAFTPREIHPDADCGRPVLVIDPSSGRKDAFTYGVARWVLGPNPYQLNNDGTPRLNHLGEPTIRIGVPTIEPFLQFVEVGALAEGTFWDSTSSDTILDKLRTIASRHSVTHVYSDQREEFLLRAAIERRGLHFTSIAWTNESKTLAVEGLRRWLAEKRLALPIHDKLKRELHSFEERVTPNGSFTFAARGKSHDDYVAVLLTAAMADSRGGIQSSPYRKKVFRGVLTKPILAY